jgi:hypothetical protein
MSRIPPIKPPEWHCSTLCTVAFMGVSAEKK